MTTPSQEEIEQLAKDHGVRPDYDFQEEIGFAFQRYEVMKNLKYDDAKVFKATDKLAKKAKHLVAAIREFDEALSEFDGLSKNPAAERMPPLFRNTENQRDRVRREAELWAKGAIEGIVAYEDRTLLKKVTIDKKEDKDKEENKSGFKTRIPDNPPLAFLVNRLICIYSESIDGNIGISQHRKKHYYYGPMFRFIEDCLALVGIEEDNKKLGKLIEKQKRAIEAEIDPDPGF